MKKSILGLALAATVSLSAQHLDGEYLENKNYGSAGDPVLAEVNQQIADYADAKIEAEGIQSGELKGDLRKAQQACVDTCLYSWVQANYLAEMGRLSAVAGDTTQALIDYRNARDAANRAIEADCNEAAKTKKSHVQGEIILKVVKRALKRLGVED